MNTKYKLSTILIVFFSNLCVAQSQLIKNLEEGKIQTLVVYGTSLSAGVGGVAWVNAVSDHLNRKFHGRLKTINTAKSAMWSTWGVQHLEDSVIQKKPNAVLIEFSINDAYLNYKTSPELARLNLNYIIDRIKLYSTDCEIILQIMNIPIDKHADTRPNLDQYMQAYREVANEQKFRLIDHYPYWQEILNSGKENCYRYVADGIQTLRVLTNSLPPIF
jgi:acyl-CoA thioesterase-1